MDRQDISFNTKDGVVEITQSTKNGVATIVPIKVVVPVDAWLSVACLLIQGQIQDRQTTLHSIAQTKQAQG